MSADPASAAGRPGGGPVLGRVCRSGRGTCDVRLDPPTGPTVTAAWSPAVHRAVAADPTAVPVVGDVVEIDTTDARRPLVAATTPRRTALLRADVAPGTSHGQVLAANVDVVAVVEGMVPDPDAGRVERLLALAWSSGAEPVLVMTKADLASDPGAVARAAARLAPAVEVLAVSATAGTGLEPLRTRLAGGATVALLGASGVGKSTLLNALVGTPVMATRALRSDGKGRHTTVSRELHPVPGGGAVVDTPGLRSVGLTGTERVEDVFAEIAALAEGCRFADCAHETEPDCAVLAAIADGDLTHRRLESYRALLREQDRRLARTDARLRAAEAGKVRAWERARRRTPTRR